MHLLRILHPAPFRRAPARAIVVGLLLLLASVGTSLAAAPHIVGGLTDQVGALGSCRSQVLAAQQQLFDKTGSQLYLVFVDTTNGVDMSDYVNQLLDGSNGQVTEQDALLAVATGDRQYQLYTGSTLNGKIGATELDSVTSNFVRPSLAKNDWCGAATGAATGLQAAITGQVNPDTNPGQSSGGGGPLGLPTWLWLVIILAILGFIGFWIWRGRANHQVYLERAAQEDLGKQASSLLISTDDALRAADQEVGFAQAQFGDEQAAPFAKALTDAKEELRQAFLLSQQLDDDKPETPDQRHAMLQEIVDRCTKAKGMVDDQMARVQKLRDLARNVEQVLPQTASLADAQVARVAVAKATLAGLSGKYAAENVAAVTANPDAASKKLDAAKAALAAAQASLAGNQRDAAVQGVQQAESAIADATQLLDAVDATQKSLADGEAQLTTSIAAVQQDITQARAAIAAGKGTERAADVERAAQQLAQAQTLAAATPLDVVGATRATTEANTTIDAVLAGIQEADAAVQRNASAAQVAIANANASVAQANALVAAAGGSAAGRRARTRVSQAGQYLARAQSLLATDPATAAQAANTADALADEAIAEMQAATGSSSGMGWNGPTMGGPDPYGGGGPGIGGPSGGYGSYRAPSGGGGLESFLGGLLGGMLSGGGGGRSTGWSGGSGGFGGFGSGGFGGGSGNHSGGRSSGGFSIGGGGGGGGHSGRRSGGGF